MASMASRENGLYNQEHVPLLIVETTIQPKSNIIKRYLVFSSRPRSRFFTSSSGLAWERNLALSWAGVCGEEMKNECVRGSVFSEREKNYRTSQADLDALNARRDARTNLTA